jgi:hypothetical protein
MPDESDLNDGSRIAKKGTTYIRTAERNGLDYYTYHHLAKTNTAPSLMPLRITVHCSDEDHVAMNTHACPEFVYVSRGPIRFHWRQTGPTQCETLETGDSLYIAPDVEHSFTCVEEDGEIIAINFQGD